MLYRENGQFKTTYRADQQIFPIFQDRVAIIGLILFAYIAVPLLGNNYLYSAILLPFLIMSLAAIGVNILIGYCGQISLGSAAFMAMGAYSSYNVIMRIPDMPLLLALVIGGVCSAIFGVLFGLPSLRVRGLYLAVATLAAQFFSEWMFLRVKWFTLGNSSGSAAISKLSVFGIPLDSNLSKYIFCLTVLIVIALLAKNLVRGAIGREWMAIRDMDVAAYVIGIRPVYAKLSAFAVSSFILGLAGSLWAFIYLVSWEPEAFSLDLSLKMLFMVIIGGLGSIAGNFLGAAFIVILPIFLAQLLPVFFGVFGIVLTSSFITHVETIVFGCLIIMFLILEPHGLAKLWSTGKQKLRVWPFPH